MADAQDPVHQEADGWYFYDETWADRQGPFPSEAITRVELKKYGEWLNTGRVAGPPVELTVIRHTHFWTMANDIRNFCRATTYRVLSHDDQERRTIGFVTACAETDPLYHEWRISLADVSLTANRRRDVEFAGLSDEEKIALTKHLQTREGRVVLAEILSGASV